LRISETRLAGAYLIEPELLKDERGFFARTFCRGELQALKLETHIEQCSISFNLKKGTLRGMHYQIAPDEEVKIVRCTMGAVFDVIIDLRPGAPTFRQWISVELSEENRRMVYIPKGFAHGFQTLRDDSELQYQISIAHAPASSRGIRWDDPALAISWPLPVTQVSEKDLGYPPL
jgi:dTDP-4-dehydrorhamnose 3,5-epimerase